MKELLVYQCMYHIRDYIYIVQLPKRDGCPLAASLDDIPNPSCIDTFTKFIPKTPGEAFMASFDANQKLYLGDGCITRISNSPPRSLESDLTW